MCTRESCVHRERNFTTASQNDVRYLRSSWCGCDRLNNTACMHATPPMRYNRFQIIDPGPPCQRSFLDRCSCRRFFCSAREVRRFARLFQLATQLSRGALLNLFSDVTHEIWAFGCRSRCCLDVTVMRLGLSFMYYGT